MNIKKSYVNQSPEISIIMAVYMAETYIRRCLDSISNQSFKDFEVIIIIDGSPDNSGRICESYKRKDPRFKVFYQENRGVSSARQAGIERATGKYSIHIDPDDWMEPKMLELMYLKTIKEDVDICCCKYHIIDDNKQPIITPKYLKSIPQITEVQFFEKYGMELWNKLIRHSLYNKFSISFPNNLKIGEDKFVILKLIEYSPSICLIKEKLYHYDRKINNNAITKSTNKIIWEIENLKYIKNNVNSKSIVQYFNYAIANLANNAILENKINNDEFKKLFEPYRKNIINSAIPMRRKINIICEFIGLSPVSRPLYVFIKSIYIKYINLLS